MVKDVTPLPDQDTIREDVAWAKYRSKIDLADAYKQVRVEPGDIKKTVFSTILGTYVSNVVAGQLQRPSHIPETDDLYLLGHDWKIQPRLPR